MEHEIAGVTLINNVYDALWCLSRLWGRDRANVLPLNFNTPFNSCFTKWSLYYYFSDQEIDTSNRVMDLTVIKAGKKKNDSCQPGVTIKEDLGFKSESFHRFICEKRGKNSDTHLVYKIFEFEIIPLVKLAPRSTRYLVYI